MTRSNTRGRDPSHVGIQDSHLVRTAEPAHMIRSCHGDNYLKYCHNNLDVTRLLV